MMSLAIETRNRPAEKWRRLQRGRTRMQPSATTGRSAAATSRLPFGRATTSSAAASTTVVTRADAEPALQAGDGQDDEAGGERAEDGAERVDRVGGADVAADRLERARDDAHGQRQDAAHAQRRRQDGERGQQELAEDDAVDGEGAAAQEAEEGRRQLVHDQVATGRSSRAVARCTPASHSIGRAVRAVSRESRAAPPARPTRKASRMSVNE